MGDLWKLAITAQLLVLYTWHICCQKKIDTIQIMLTSALRALVKNPVKESFYGKRKKIINILTAFFISHKNKFKTFFNWILNQCPKGTR